jgi:hypothetical protein
MKSVPQRKQHFTITKVMRLTLFKEIIDVYTYRENHTKPINTKCTVTDCNQLLKRVVPTGLKVKGLSNIFKQLTTLIRVCKFCMFLR